MGKRYFKLTNEQLERVSEFFREYPYGVITFGWKGETMNILNVYLLLIGIFMLIMGIVWSKKNWINVFIKILYLVSGTYLILYALNLSKILLVVHISWKIYFKERNNTWLNIFVTYVAKNQSI